MKSTEREKNLKKLMLKNKNAVHKKNLLSLYI